MREADIVDLKHLGTGLRSYYIGREADLRAGRLPGLRDKPPEPLPLRHGMIPDPERVSLHILMVNRWIMILCQISIGLFFILLPGFTYSAGAVFSIIAVAVALNLICLARGNAKPWLETRTATLSMGFDIVQLTALLYLTGGLANPFAVLMLAPVTVAAKILPRAHLIFVVGLALLSLTFIGQFHAPLPWIGDQTRALPAGYLGIIWLALCISTIVVAYYAFGIAQEARLTHHARSTTQMALAREQRTASLGALAAAAAHNLGSPLGTIAIIAKEMAHDVQKDDPYYEDVQLLLSEIGRCREILARISERPESDPDDPFARIGLTELVELARAPYKHKAVDFTIQRDDDCAGKEPIGWRSPESLYGLGNLIHNALELAERRVVVSLYWDEERVEILIGDDGPGFPSNLLPRLGEPYLSTRAGTGEHLGLGIFISQTLLGYTGATLKFYNRSTVIQKEMTGDHAITGACVNITWPREVFERGTNYTRPYS